MNDIAPKYAAEVERLKDADAETLECSWVEYEPLFQFCSPTGENLPVPRRGPCGCLILIRGDMRMHAWTPRLTREIRADERLPKTSDELTATRSGSPERIAVLTTFAEWQTRLDCEIRQPANVLPE